MDEKIDHPGSDDNVYSNLARLITPGQAAILEAALYEVRRAGGFGRVTLTMQGGVVKFISTEIRKEAAG